MREAIRETRARLGKRTRRQVIAGGDRHGQKRRLEAGQKRERQDRWSKEQGITAGFSSTHEEERERGRVSQRISLRSPLGMT